MSKKAMYELRNMLCDELDELARKGELGAGDLEIAHKLTDTIKNIDKIEMLEDDGYSNGGDWEADMRGTYGRNVSMRNRHRDSRGRYSRGADLREQLNDMMRDTDDERIKDALRRVMNLVEG